MKNNATPAVTELAWKELYKASRTVPVPFNLVLTDSDDILTCFNVVRIMPGKRIVAFGTWGAKPVVAKLFYDLQGAAKKAKADYDGVNALIERGIPTPKPLYKGAAQNNRIHVILYERIFNAEDLDTLWQEKSDIKDYDRLLHAVTIELATQHVLGIKQRDLHFKNFLITGKKIYTLDGGDIEQFDSPLSKKETIDNVALFFSQLGVGTETLQQKLLKVYARSRGWIIRKHEALKLQQAISAWTKKRWIAYRAKIMRSCTAFSRVDASDAVVIYDRRYESAEMVAILKNPELAFSLPTTQILKAGNSATVAKVVIDNRAYVLKRYNIKNIWHRLRRCVRSSRAATSWRIAQYLRWAGFPTAKPIAFIERRFLGLRGRSYFLMEYVKGEDAGAYFDRYRKDPEQAVPVAERIVELFRNLAALQMTHGDLKMTNIIINQNHHPVMIDLDGVATHRTQSSFDRTFHKELARFMKNWQNNPAISHLFAKLIQE